MRLGMVLLAVTALAACGVDGEPVRPQVDTNISLGADGIQTSTGVRVRQGPVSVGVSF